MWCCGRKTGGGGVVAKNNSQIRRLGDIGVHRDAPPPQVRCDIEAPVLLNVYSLVENNEKLAKLGMGIYHSGVIVYGIEWSYGEVVDNPNASGLFCVHPGRAAGELFRTIRIGVTTRSPMQVDTILHRLENEWRSCDYHILHHNCNHFAQRLCNLLSTVEKLRVPSWCNRAARVSDRVVPRKLATKVLRMMDDDPPKAKPPPPKTNVSELPVSIIPAKWYRHPKVAQPPRYCYIVSTHEWSNSQMSTPHSSQVSSPAETDLDNNNNNENNENDSFVPPPGFRGSEPSPTPVLPLTSLEEKQPSTRTRPPVTTTTTTATTVSASSSAGDSKKRPRPRADVTSAPAPPLSSVEESHWPPLAPSRGHSIKSTSIRSNNNNNNNAQNLPPGTPVHQSSAIYSPASRGSSRAGSFVSGHADPNEVVFSSSRSGAVPVMRRRDSTTTGTPTTQRGGRPPMAPQSHHSGGSPQMPETELSTVVFDRLSLPDSSRGTALLMVIPEIDFTPSPSQAKPVGVVLNRSDAEPDERRASVGNRNDAGEDSSVASSVVGEDVALVMESELDAALAAQEEEEAAFHGSHGVGISDSQPGNIGPRQLYDECAAAALQSPLSAVEFMKRRHKQEDARALAAHTGRVVSRRASSYSATGGGAGAGETLLPDEGAAFTNLAAVPDSPQDDTGSAVVAPEAPQERYRVPEEEEEEKEETGSPPVLTAHDMRPPRLQPPPRKDLSDTPPAPQDVAASAVVVVDGAAAAAAGGSESLGSLSPLPLHPVVAATTSVPETLPSVPEASQLPVPGPISPVSHDTSDSPRQAVPLTSEILWPAESSTVLGSGGAARLSITSDRGATTPFLKPRAASMSDGRYSATTPTPRRPQLAERRRSEARTRSNSPRSRRGSLPGTPQTGSAMCITPPQLPHRVLALGGSPNRDNKLTAAAAAAVAQVPPEGTDESGSIKAWNEETKNEEEEL